MIGYEAQVVAVTQLYGLFSLYALACWLLIRPTLSARHWLPTYMASAIILGPITLGLILTLLFWVAPGRGDAFYGAILVAAPLVICLARLRALISDIRSLQRAAVKHGFGSRIALAGLLLFTIAAGFLAFPLLVLPLHGNDQLEYMQLGRLLYELRDIHVYPLRTALPSSGFLAPWTHPPTYGSLIALAFMLQGTAAITGAAKLISLWFALGTAGLVTALVFAADRRLSWRLWLTPFLTMSVPVYFEISQTAHIDAMRIAIFTTAIALTAHAVTSGSRGAFLLAAYAIGCASMTHSIGILASLIALPLVVACWRGSLLKLCESLAIMLLTIAAMAAPYYLRNIAIFGSPISDSTPVWEIQQLGVAEFLRGERGLETFADRFVLGVLMPFTRTNLFGLLPTAGALIALMILARHVIRPGRRATAAAMFSARNSDAAIPLLVAVLGYFTMLFLSVLAGTELAVKNARYILTVVPLLVALTMIGTGRLIPDDAVDNARHRLAAWFARLILRRRRATTESTALVQLTGGAVAIRLLTGVLVAQQGYDVFRLTHGNMRVYFSNGDMITRRLLESEQAKRDGSMLDDAAVEGIARAMMGPDDTALVFRQASFGFYTSPRFRFHIDTALTGLFEITDPRDLRDAMLKQGLKWIHTPGYPMPEINNSAFAALLRDPRLVRPVARSNGWAFYRVREADAPVEEVELAKVFPMVREGTQLYATTDQGPGAVDGVSATLRLDPQGGFAELTRQRGPVKELNRWDAILSKPVRTRNDPNLTNSTDFELTDENRVLIDATLSGSGLAEIVVEYLAYPPVTSGLTDLYEREDSIGSPQLNRETIWSGLLSDAPKNVGGWLVSAPSRIGDQRTKRSARMIFRLRDGKVLRVHGWRARAVSFETNSRFGYEHIFEDAINKGWLFTATSLNARLGVRIRTQPSMAANDDRWPFPPIGLKRVSDTLSLVSPPPFRQAADGGATSSRNAMIEDLFIAGDLRIKLKASLSGYGQITPIVLFRCRFDPARSFDGNTAAAKKPEPDAIPMLSLPPIQLWGDKTETLSWTVSPPCIPRSVRVAFRNERQRLLVAEQLIADVSKQEYGYLDVGRVEASLSSGAPQSSFDLPLIPSSDAPVSAR